MSPSDVQDLYLASAAVSVDLAYLGITAKKERKYGNGTDTRNRAMERARDITHKFQDKKELVQSAQALEARMGVAGAVSAVEEISSSEVVEINWTRYSLGAAVYALGYDELKQRSVVGVFRAGILTEMGRYEETMLDFLDELQRPESYVNLQSNMDMIRRHSFPLFLFAGTMPMGYKGNH